MWGFIGEFLITVCAPNTARFIYIFMVKKFHKCEIKAIFVAYQRVSASKCAIDGCQEAFGGILGITSHSIGHANREPSILRHGNAESWIQLVGGSNWRRHCVVWDYEACGHNIIGVKLRTRLEQIHFHGAVKYTVTELPLDQHSGVYIFIFFTFFFFLS